MKSSALTSGWEAARAGAALSRLLLLLVLAWVLASWPAGAQDEAAAAQARRDRLGEAEQVVSDPEAPLRELEALREELRAIRSEAAAFKARLEGPRADARRALDALGPPPAADAPPEPEAVAEQRRDLEARAAEIEAAARLSDVNIETANRLLDRIAEIRRERFFERALQPRASVLHPTTWANAAGGARAAAMLTSAELSKWIAERREAGSLGFALAILGVALALAAAVQLLRRILRARVGVLGAVGRFGEDPREVVAGLRALLRIGAVIGSVLILFAAARSQGLMAPPLGLILGAALATLTLVALADAVTRPWYAPGDSSLRLARVPDDARARRHWLYVLAAAAVGATGWMIAATGETLSASVPALHAAAVIEALVGSIVLFLFALEAGDRPAPDAARRRARIPWLRLALMAAALASFGAAVGGYGALGRFVVERTALAIVAVVGFRLARAFTHRLVLGLMAPRALREPSTEDETFAFWVRLVLDAALALVALPLAAFIVGFEHEDILEAIDRAMLGVRIGNVELSLTSLAAAAAIFIAVLAVTRFFQRTLSRSVLPRTRMDSGARDSIVALVGYGGLILGIVFAIAAAGFDLTNIAIIAGALSVGVGLGLQGLVANFVSGVALLFERPFKIGDLIALPPPLANQGVVKKIGMRATEIQTFDHSSIIVPNAQLLSGVFTNLTLRDRVGRVLIPVRVNRAADPQLVHRLLLETAQSHPETLSDPPPFVLWKDFGGNTMLFEISAHVRDMGRTLTVQNDLRFSIWRAFKEHGVETAGAEI